MDEIKTIIECLTKDGLWKGSAETVKLLRKQSGVGDGTSIYLLGRDYILHLSPPKFPRRAALDAATTLKIREALTTEAAAHVVEVVSQGEVDGRSWLLLPRHRPLSSNRIISKLQRQLLRPTVLKWLRDLAEQDVPNDNAANEYRASLNSLIAMPNMPEPIRQDARDALSLLETASFTPFFTPMHGDLWRGNILFKSIYDFAVIDWGGSQIEGYGIFDLVRYALSDRMSSKQLLAELRTHAHIMQIDLRQTIVPLLGAFGHFARNLGEFPEDRFITMASQCHSAWQAALQS